METSDKPKADAGSNRTYWHPAFLLAVQMELFDYRDSLEFKHEYQLTSEPLRIDLLVIKKPKNVTIDKNIARIFRSDNLFEYKSPTDYLAINDFLKVYAYANLYAAITPGVDLADITITFVTNRYPRKLLHYLANVRRYTVNETSPGIYQVTGDFVPIQIIESRKLPAEENLWLNSLRNDLQAENVGTILQQGKQFTQEMRVDAYMDIIHQANLNAFMEVKRMWSFTEFALEGLTENGVLPKLVEEVREQGIEQGREQGIEQERKQGRSIIAQNLLNMGMPIEEIAQATELPVESIRALA